MFLSISIPWDEGEHRNGILDTCLINLAECRATPRADGLFRNCCSMMLLLMIMMMMMTMTTGRLVRDLLLSPKYDFLQLVHDLPSPTNCKGQLKCILKILMPLKVLVVAKLVKLNYC